MLLNITRRTMAFKVELKKSNIDSIYELLTQKESRDIGSVIINEGGINSISTRLSHKKQYYGLESTIDLENRSIKKIPADEIRNQLSKLNEGLPEPLKYNIKNSSEHQMIIEKEGKEYFFEPIKNGCIEIITKNKIGSKKELENILKDYSNLLEIFFSAYSSKNKIDMPDIVYTPGRDLVIYEQVPAESAVKGKSSNLSFFENKIEIASPNVSYEEIVGVKTLKAECKRIFKDLTNPERAYFFGRDPSRQKNVLIHGEKGSGKTMTVSALATELKEKLGNDKVKFYSVDYSQITSIFRGGEAQATAKLFDLAESNEKNDITTILFLDEVHQIGKRQREYNEALDIMLSRLDGIKKYRNTVIMGSTYMELEILDPAFVDRHKTIKVEPLTIDEKCEILKKTVEKKKATAEEYNKKLFADLDYDKLKQELKKLNGRSIGSEHGIVEAVVEWKYDNTNDTKDFTPITTEEVIEVLKTFKPVEKQKVIGIKSNKPN